MRLQQNKERGAGAVQQRGRWGRNERKSVPDGCVRAWVVVERGSQGDMTKNEKGKRGKVQMSGCCSGQWEEKRENIRVFFLLIIEVKFSSTKL